MIELCCNVDWTGTAPMNQELHAMGQTNRVSDKQDRFFSHMGFF